jgi:antitoxin ParD1/3/4
MTTVSIAVPDSARAFIDAQAVRAGYANLAEYVQALICEDQICRSRDVLERQLREGLDSGEPIEVNDEFWADFQLRFAQRRGKNGER